MHKYSDDGYRVYTYPTIGYIPLSMCMDQIKKIEQQDKMMDINKKIEVMQHYADGGKVRSLVKDTGECSVHEHDGLSEPSWNWKQCIFEIVEEERSLDEIWEDIYENNATVSKCIKQLCEEIDKRYKRINE